MYVATMIKRKNEYTANHKVGHHIELFPSLCLKGWYSIFFLEKISKVMLI